MIYIPVPLLHSPSWHKRKHEDVRPWEQFLYYWLFVKEVHWLWSYLLFVCGETTSHGGFPSQERVSNAELWYFLCCKFQQATEQTDELSVIRDTLILYCSYVKNIDMIRSYFYICSDSSAVGECAKLWDEWITTTIIKDLVVIYLAYVNARKSLETSSSLN